MTETSIDMLVTELWIKDKVTKIIFCAIEGGASPEFSYCSMCHDITYPADNYSYKFCPCKSKRIPTRKECFEFIKEVATLKVKEAIENESTNKN